MNDFERQYYEDDKFWRGEALQDDSNVKRINYTARLVPADVTSVVDIGCGNGVFLSCLSTIRPDINLFGVDRSQTALRYVNFETRLADIASTGLDRESFDCVTCLEVIEHLPVSVYDAGLRELARISRKYIIISVPFEEDLEESSNQCPSCKTIFNRELHLRSFDDDKLKYLFQDFGFCCKTLDHLGASKKLKYHYRYRRLFYPEQFRKFQSPICPVCGFRSDEKNAADPSSPQSPNSPKMGIKQRILSTISAIPKRVWPKETKYYWVIALFEKCEDRSISGRHKLKYA